MYYKKYGELPQISNSSSMQTTSQLAAANLIHASKSGSSKASHNATNNNGPNSNAEPVKSKNSANKTNNTSSGSSSSKANTNSIGVVKSEPNKETRPLSSNSNTNNEEDDQEVYENDLEDDDDDEEADYDDDDDPAVSNIDDINDLDDQEDRCDQEVNEINNKTLKEEAGGGGGEEVKREPSADLKTTAQTKNTPSPPALIKREDEVALKQENMPLNLKMENDFKTQSAVNAKSGGGGFLSINNLISSSAAQSLPKTESVPHSPNSKSALVAANSASRQPQSHTPDTNLGMVSNSGLGNANRLIQMFSMLLYWQFY